MTVTRNQIVVTNCLRVGTPSTQDLGDLFKQAKQMPGFLRINFSAAEKNASTFISVLPMTRRWLGNAVPGLGRHCFRVKQCCWKDGKSPPPLDQTANPSSVLYVRMMKGMTAEALLKIVSDLTGLINLCRTVHVQSLDRDFDGLYKLFLELPGANRIGYHKGYIFLCFDKHVAAKSAVSRINTSTRMKARTVEFEYSPHFTPGSIGTPGKMVRMNFITTSESEVRNVFMTRPGFTKLFYTSKKCWALFSTVEHARECVEHFNDRTNIKVVFCNKALSK
ncbi:hypothetical protein BCR33DRAFT_780495 [Rhizoclosmatium globosum]|uniref:Uncharacterized protein n=1 Tax=Rhizoclosmatium globosum TaxID=329046 RepID=A0A1Y2CXB4_9FUNG|nr:hypothetical protein BCR33DRAFT_780495 [Rhizoclosmatium globosum]|eukprot:ORY51536.1 hypothetical protein BCR33DRAFT_780495 [Rhizoclosmatium globosum]